MEGQDLPAHHAADPNLKIKNPQNPNPINLAVDPSPEDQGHLLGRKEDQEVDRRTKRVAAINVSHDLRGVHPEKDLGEVDQERERGVEADPNKDLKGIEVGQRKESQRGILEVAQRKDLRVRDIPVIQGTGKESHTPNGHGLGHHPTGDLKDPLLETENGKDPQEDQEVPQGDVENTTLYRRINNIKSK